VHHVGRAVFAQYRAGLQAGQIAARGRLAVALAPPDLAAHDARQVLLLLRLVAELQEHRAEHPQAEAAQRDPTAERAQLLLEHARLGGREAAAAVLARPGR